MTHDPSPTNYDPSPITQHPEPRLPLYYTFANHMHWVDMEWLWGYFVLPSSVRDMIHFCNETGAKGNINFDAIGYEKLAVESPEALAELRDAIARGQIEVAGASYGQPYGLFHPGESNVRQRVYGARTVRKMLGVWPKTFWEEEFDFFPQLPQMLAQAGHKYASLFFQWTWHTPEVPREEIPAIWWEGLDGTRLLCATRNALNLHQWPEDFAGLLDGPAPREMPAAGIQQWLELMPSPDWMCRSELLLPQLKQLMQHPDFEIRPVTLPEYLEVAKPFAEPRSYTMDDVFHGMSLGKNGDLIRRTSHAAEHQLLAAESISSIAGFFGRPYPGWNVYPTWELEESWRELLSAQHHDNDECEGLNGHIGLRSYERSEGLSRHVLYRTHESIARRTQGEPGRIVLYNPLGWPRSGYSDSFPHERAVQADSVPPFGYLVLPSHAVKERFPCEIEETETHITLRRGSFSVSVDRVTGRISSIESPLFPDGVLSPDAPLLQFSCVRDGETDSYAHVEKVEHEVMWSRSRISVTWHDRLDRPMYAYVSIAPDFDAVDIELTQSMDRPDPGLRAALRMPLIFNVGAHRLIHDHPYGVGHVEARGKTFLRKYPTGDWMTSPQWFEEIENPFTALSLLDFDGGDRGVLYLHNGSQAFQRVDDTVFNIFSMYDPWDERYFHDYLEAKLRILPHGSMTNTQRWRAAQEFLRPLEFEFANEPGGDLPAEFGAVWCDAPNVAVTALFRETPETGQYLESYAGAGIDFPHIVRLVEFDGEPAVARLTVPGPVAAARKATTLGVTERELPVAPAAPPLPSLGGEWAAVTVEMRPHEIATVYLDLVPGRKVNRDLDAHRNVWATVHRVGE